MLLRTFRKLLNFHWFLIQFYRIATEYSPGDINLYVYIRYVFNLQPENVKNYMKKVNSPFGFYLSKRSIRYMACFLKQLKLNQKWLDYSKIRFISAPIEHFRCAYENRSQIIYAIICHLIWFIFCLLKSFDNNVFKWPFYPQSMKIEKWVAQFSVAAININYAFTKQKKCNRKIF